MNPAPVRISRDAPAKFTATNGRGASIKVGRSQDGADFSPVELLMAALGACAALSADHVISRRLGDDAPIDVEVTAEKDEEADRLTSMATRFDLDMSVLGQTDQDTLVKLVARAVERTCTVSHTIEPGVPVALSVDQV
ncbi:OsmC family protein [Actinocrispum wychmicini]|uniref:Putative OsmC-like protein n=1 Tax=Actinocrispum wychmicini TaxID=1213861 RepID=A0A4V2S7A7_9PSEU|nr:OsmC family protein [Actinocrispum wychmicini]TCO59190.1 putative OsmC-like protein [Actinocrispum wychmicini]